jgi:hypothetical protein
MSRIMKDAYVIPLNRQELRLRSLRGNRLAETKARQYQEVCLPTIAKRRTFKKRCRRMFYEAGHQHQKWKQGWHARLDAKWITHTYTCAFTTIIKPHMAETISLTPAVRMMVKRFVIFSNFPNSLIVESIRVGANELLVKSVCAVMFNHRQVNPGFQFVVFPSHIVSLRARNYADYDVDVRAQIQGECDPELTVYPRRPLMTWRQRKVYYRQWFTEELV